jgi:uncharacterized protein (TIGR00255 family)
MKIRSMTGFARVRETIGDVDVVLSIKSVNHRGLDCHFYTGAELDPFENAMRGTVKRHIARGHLDIRTQITRAGVAGPLGVDSAKLDAYVTAFNLASRQYSLSTPMDLNSAFRVPGVLSESSVVELTADFEAPLTAVLERALHLLNTFREREGSEIAGLLLERAESVRRMALEIETCRKSALPAYQNRLRERLSDLLAGAAIDPQRLVQEAALLADRSDIGEEIDRLKIHASQVHDLLRTGDEVGKKLDFLLQEMNRETNTILSKTSGLGDHGLRITELAVGAKSDIEKMREQVLNLE